ncbi:molybdopterin molybdenumtransferase MoeA [Halobacteriales archaeon QH_7_65_31]|nr:MAG: molybdopterin molybdenumtransferase MoeA [Halobacteriales archaeon QH_7_65_31]
MHDSGIKHTASAAETRRVLAEIVPSPTETATLPLARATGRVLAHDSYAEEPVPPERRATTTGVAVNASATYDASERTPVRLRETTGSPAADEAIRVTAGEPLPERATAVVPSDAVERTEDAVAVTTAVAEGAHIATVGSDIDAGELLYPTGTRLTPAALGALATAGHGRVSCFAEPTVGIVPVGRSERVTAPGRTLAGLVGRWGGRPEPRDPVAPEPRAVRPALQRDLTRDVVVTVGGTEAAGDPVVTSVLNDLGDRRVRGVAISPGRVTTIGVVEGTPVLSVPGTVVGSLVAATQLVRPALERAGGGSLPPIPMTETELDGKLPSTPGERTFARVRLSEDEQTATPIAAGAPTQWSTVTAADGWVAVPEASEGIDSGETVAVERWSV